MKKVSIHRDGNPDNPREIWEPFGQLIVWLAGYNLGDDPALSAKGGRALAIECRERGDLLLELVVAYRGTDIQIRPRDGRGEDQAGITYATTAQIEKEFGGDRARAEAALRAELAVYNHYLDGEVWGARIRDKGGYDEQCWGFYGDTLEGSGVGEFIVELTGDTDLARARSR